MILSELLTAEVRGDAPVGFVVDVRFVVDAPGEPDRAPEARLYGLIVSPHAKFSPMGFERKDLASPWPIAQIQGWLHRGSFLVHWEDVAAIGRGWVRLRPGFTRYDARLPEEARTLDEDW